MIHESILSTIGNTPVVRVNRIAPAHTTLYVKCEFFNPMSSVKDRLAIALIELGGRSLRTIIREARTRLKPGRSVHCSRVGRAVWSRLP